MLACSTVNGYDCYTTRLVLLYVRGATIRGSTPATCLASRTATSPAHARLYVPGQLPLGEGHYLFFLRRKDFSLGKRYSRATSTRASL